MMVATLGLFVATTVFAVTRSLWPHDGTTLLAAKVAATAAGTAVNFALLRNWVFAPRAARGVASPEATALLRLVRHPLALLLFLALLVRVPLLISPGYGYDTGLFQEWAASVAQHGLAETIRRPDVNYVGYNYVLGAIAFVYQHLAHPLDLATDPGLARWMKLPALVGDLGCVAMLYLTTSRFITPRARPASDSPRSSTLFAGLIPWWSSLTKLQRLGVAAGALYAFNPATLYGSAYWGQVDSLTALAMLASLACALSGRPGLAAATIAAGFLIKPHAVVLVPLLGWLILSRHGPTGLIRGTFAGLVTLAAGLAYYAWTGTFGRVVQIYEELFEVGDQVTVSAWNIWWLAYRTYEQIHPNDVLLAFGSMDVTPHVLSSVLLALAGVSAVAFAGRRPSAARVCIAAAFLVCCFYMLPMKIHERYLFPFFALLAPVAVINMRWFLLYAAFSVTFVLNLYAIYPFPPPDSPIRAIHAIDQPADTIIAAVNVAMFLLFAGALAVPAIREWRQWLPAWGRRHMEIQMPSFREPPGATGA